MYYMLRSWWYEKIEVFIQEIVRERVTLPKQCNSKD